MPDDRRENKGGSQHGVIQTGTQRARDREDREREPADRQGQASVPDQGGRADKGGTEHERGSKSGQRESA